MHDPIGKLNGKVLSSVEFVHDYIQLRFDGPCLSVYSDFAIQSSQRKISKGEEGYRDFLCERIGQYVLLANTIIDTRITIELSDNTKIVISLKPEHRIGPEAATLVMDANEVFVW